jgi:hypothetical protein
MPSLNRRICPSNAVVEPSTARSALTRVLRTALTGRGKLVLVATVSPA